MNRTLPCLFLVLAAACSGTQREQDTAVTTNAAPAADGRADIHSFARPERARVTDVALDLAADFDSRTLAGTATLTVERAAGAAEIVLDTRDLEIAKVTDSKGGDLKFALGAADPILGKPLTVTLPAEGPIVVHYKTSPGAAALQWLTPAQTAGKKLPFLYSQGQAILTRTWIPTQDSPGIRQTYSARIATPRNLRAVMSAEHLTPEGKVEGDRRVFEFKLTNPVPPYLIAIAIGDISSRAVGPRTAVFAEPSVQARASAEFADLETMVEKAEPLLGPYRWGRYDLLVLPPSFPFGGMENPRLTFATPTILAGDKSLVALVAHELAHSWSGNLVTNATWSDFWLNEGTTSYVERRIMEAVYGPERAQMLRVLAWGELQDEIARLGGPTHKDTILHIDLKGRDPDDGATQIPYEKGAAFLETIEAAVGRERFDAWLRSYFDRFAFKPITSEAFLAEVRTNLLKGDTALEQKLMLEDWVYKPGLPSNAVAPKSDAFDRVQAQVDAFMKGASAASLATKGWSTQQWQHFIDNLQQLTPEQMADLDRTFKLTASGNSEVLFAWLRVGIRHRYLPAQASLERFLTTQGRRKFLRPLYEDLMRYDWGAPEAQRIYAIARPMYHSVATGTLDPIVNPK